MQNPEIQTINPNYALSYAPQGSFMKELLILQESAAPYLNVQKPVKLYSKDKRKGKV